MSKLLIFFSASRHAGQADHQENQYCAAVHHTGKTQLRKIFNQEIELSDSSFTSNVPMVLRFFMVEIGFGKLALYL